MAIKVDKVNRRMFLQGSGGVVVAIPFMSSLLGGGTAAAATRPLRFVALHHNYGAYRQNFFPGAAGVLAPAFQDAAANITTYRLRDALALAPAFAGRQDFLDLAEKIAFVQGLDKLGYINHHAKTMLCGAYNTLDPQSVSIDQLIAGSGTIYPSEPYMRSMHLGSNHERNRISWEFTGGKSKSKVQHESPAAALDFTFSNIGTSPEHSAKIRSDDLSMLDFVRAEYKDLLGSSKLSTEDKSRLLEHADLIRSLETRTANRPIMTCGRPVLETDLTGASGDIAKMLLLVETLIKCNLTNVITYSVHAQVLGDYHGNSHGNNGIESTANSVESNKTMVARMAEPVGRFLKALDTPEAGGPSTYLDNTIFLWSSDMGSEINHCPLAIPVFLAGGKGILRTGELIDYRNPVASRFRRGYAGRPFNELQISLLKSMGVQPQKWEKNNTPGFGSYNFSNYDGEHYNKYDFEPGKKGLLPRLFIG